MSTYTETFECLNNVVHCTAQRLFLLRSCTLFDLPILFIKKRCFKFLDRMNIVIEETDC